MNYIAKYNINTFPCSEFLKKKVGVRTPTFVVLKKNKPYLMWQVRQRPEAVPVAILLPTLRRCVRATDSWS